MGTAFGGDWQGLGRIIMATSYNIYTEAAITHIYTDDGGSISSDISEDIAFDYFPDDAAVNDAIYFGRLRYRFRNLEIYVGTQFVATSVTFTWEYYDGSSWVALANVVNDDAFEKAGGQTITFDMPKDWIFYKNASYGNTWIYFIRARISTIDTPTEGGAQSTQKVEGGDNTITVTGTETIGSVYDDDVSNGWGVIDEFAYADVLGGTWASAGGRFYNFYASLSIGNGSTETSIIETNTNIFFWSTSLTITANAAFTLGTKSGSGTSAYGKSGGLLHFILCHYGFLNIGTCNLYSCKVKFLRHIPDTIFPNFGGTYEFIDTDIESITSAIPVFGGGGTMVNCNILSPSSRLTGAPTMYGMRFTKCGAHGVPSITLENSVVVLLSVGNPTAGNTYHCYLEDCAVSVVNNYTAGGTVYIHFQYHFDLKVVDNNGDGFSGVTVTIKDAEGTEIFSDVTDVNGDIAQQLLYDYKERWFDDALAETINYTPHTVTISKAGYVTRVMIYDMDRKREEVEMLDVADLTPPTFAGLVSATDTGTQSEVSLAWVAATDAGSGVAGYRIYYSQTNNVATIIAAGVQQIAEATTTGARIAGLVDNYAYYFIVRAFDWDDNEDTNVVIRNAIPTAPDPVEVAITVNITEDTIVGDVIEVAVDDDVVSDVVSSDVVQVAVIGDTVSDAVSGDVTD